MRTFVTVLALLTFGAFSSADEKPIQPAQMAKLVEFYAKTAQAVNKVLEDPTVQENLMAKDPALVAALVESGLWLNLKTGVMKAEQAKLLNSEKLDFDYESAVEESAYANLADVLAAAAEIEFLVDGLETVELRKFVLKKLPQYYAFHGREKNWLKPRMEKTIVDVNPVDVMRYQNALTRDFFTRGTPQENALGMKHSFFDTAVTALKRKK